MVSVRIRVKKPNLAVLREDGRRLDRRQIRAAQRAVDRSSRLGQARVKNQIRAVGLGRLEKVVGHSSSLKKGDRGRHPWGVIFAKGQNDPDDRGAGALEAYSEGAVIVPKMSLWGGWLWIPTNRIPKRVRRYKITPALYNRSGLVQSIGPLIFKRISRNKAILVIRRVSLSPKTGRAKAMGNRKTRTRIPMAEVVAFVGIKLTRRSKRFDQVQIMRLAAQMVPKFMDEDMALSRSRPV